MPFLRIPNPVTIAFIGYWLAPVAILIKGIGSFLSPARKTLVDQIGLLANLLIGCVAFSIWAVALAVGNGRVLPVSPSAIDLLLGASGLAVYVASILYALVDYGLGRKPDIDRWFTRWAALGVFVGAIVWAFSCALN